jgi:hypothetical protein
MNWVQVTESGGTELYINLDNVVVMRVGPTGTILRTTLSNPEGKPVTFLIQEGPADILALAQAGKSGRGAAFASAEE